MNPDPIRNPDCARCGRYIEYPFEMIELPGDGGFAHDACATTKERADFLTRPYHRSEEHQWQRVTA